MRKLVSSFIAILTLIFLGGITGCGSSKSVNNQPPARIALTYSPFSGNATRASVEAGFTLTFTATPMGTGSGALQIPVQYVSSNNAIVSVAFNGSACAGAWDSLSNPSTCRPGQVGIAEITAIARGVTSPPIMVYVHQHVDRISVDVLNPLYPQNDALNGCLTKGQSQQYLASAFSNGLDITATVGQFTWQAVNSTVINSPDTSPVTFQPNQVKITANVPGITALYASNGGTTGTGPSDLSQTATYFSTCAVQSIALSIQGQSTNSLTVAKGAGFTAQTTVLDTRGNQITGVPLTWSASSPKAVSAGPGTDTSAIAAAAAGGGSVIASCTPTSNSATSCNVGFQSALTISQPFQPIYPQAAISLSVTSNSGTAGGTAYATSTGCVQSDGTIIPNCSASLIPISIPSNSTNLGNNINLPALPNSMVFAPDGSKVFIGTSYNFTGNQGLMVVSTGSTSGVTQVSTVLGKVLAVSPNGTQVVVSDTVSTPNQVYVVTSSGNNYAVTKYTISGATAAAFSPDNLKAYIIAGSNLYVYSSQQALQTITLAAPANDVTFLSEGAFAYLAGGAPSAVTVRDTCDNKPAASPTVATPQTPLFIRTLNNGTQLLALDPPYIDLIDVSNIGPATGTNITCPFTVSNSSGGNIPLGPSNNIIPTQFILSPDNFAAYIVVKGLSSILVYNVQNRTTSAIPLAGNAIPTQASLTLDGTLLYVGANDGTVHVLDTRGPGDIQQITFPTNPSNLQGGVCIGSLVFNPPCIPDLVAVQP